MGQLPSMKDDLIEFLGYAQNRGEPLICVKFCNLKGMIIHKKSFTTIEVLIAY